MIRSAALAMVIAFAAFPATAQECSDPLNVGNTAGKNERTVVGIVEKLSMSPGSSQGAEIAYVVKLEKPRCIMNGTEKVVMLSAERIWLSISAQPLANIESLVGKHVKLVGRTIPGGTLNKRLSVPESTVAPVTWFRQPTISIVE